VIVGAMTKQNIVRIDWRDHTESIPAFLTLIGIPLSYSIADGLALGFISYPIIKVCTGHRREIGWLTYVLAAVLLLYFVFVRGRMG
jgi:AGZA family xanthine/uracil permease-like MFS transporter